jgi:hypothetical protein
MVKGPLLVEMGKNAKLFVCLCQSHFLLMFYCAPVGVHPAVASATVATMILFTSTAATVTVSLT